MAGIPAKYAFLNTVGVLPRITTYSLALLGTNEVPGKPSNAVIMAWRDELNKAYPGLIAGYSDDAVPWCGLFAAIVAHRAGKRPVTAPLWARNWAGFGVEVARNVGSDAKPSLKFADGMKASLGDTLVYVREGGGHVNSYIAEDDAYYHGVGGNQSDSVTITRIAKARCIAVRRAPMTTPPQSLRPYFVGASGAVSVNEK